MSNATQVSPPPRWALMQRYLIDRMNIAAPLFVSRYTRPDGTLIWRDEWPGMDGSDDAYESFWSFPLFYALGGSEEVHELSRKQWNALTWQFTGYGQIHREFDAYYDWMHHGESSTYLYYFGLADPRVYQDRERALRFAAMYIGEDDEAPNWDAQHKLIRSPINGSRGPRFHMTAEDWSTHRWVLANYLCPYEDTPGVDPNDPFAKADWNDDAVFEEILKRMNERMVPGDAPLNLNATSLVTSAYMYTGDEKYRRWVLDYVEAWAERAKKNGGLLPDNIGPNGEIGERMGGKWWGGYYGWRWPHGSTIMLESSLIAGENALLLTGDESYLDMHRAQWDLLWELGKTEGGAFKTPNRHGDVGWFDYRPPNPRYLIHLYSMTHNAGDKERLDRLPRDAVDPGKFGFGKGGQFHPAPWFRYIRGEYDNAPDEMLDATYRELARRCEALENDTGDPKEWDVHHWQNINPVVCEPIAQLTLGSPGAIYHGGLLHAAVRYFDPVAKRPGLPDGVAALVTGVTRDSVSLELVNTDVQSPRIAIVQAGGFAEHEFTSVEFADATGPIRDRFFMIPLDPGERVTCKFGMKRYAHRPTYDYPVFDDADDANDDIFDL